MIRLEGHNRSKPCVLLLSNNEGRRIFGRHIVQCGNMFVNEAGTETVREWPWHSGYDIVVIDVPPEESSLPVRMRTANPKLPFVVITRVGNELDQQVRSSLAPAEFISMLPGGVAAGEVVTAIRRLVPVI